MDKLVSIVIPVYNAEKTLRKSVESIVYGRYANVEVILVDDCSCDGSWELCCQLRDSYSQVKCVQNPVNSGVAVTRNHGLDVATGEYICFVDSDDWVCCRFVESLVTEAVLHPDELPVCGFRFINYLDNQTANYLLPPNDQNGFFLPRTETFQLLNHVWLQCVWNKIFHADVIKRHNIQFPPGKSMGEDFDFVLTYLEKAQCAGYRIINAPLYYYIRANTTSLMSQFGLSRFDEEATRYGRVYSICSDQSAEVDYQKSLQALKNNFYYHILSAKQLSKADKLDRIKNISKDGNELQHYRNAQRIYRKEGIFKQLSRCKATINRGLAITKRLSVKYRIARARHKLSGHDLSIISQNCIGGVLYHDLGQSFRSPTINLYMNAKDFAKFATDLRGYLSLPLQMHWEEEYPIGLLGDITIRFMHYDTCTDAVCAWQRRCDRIDWDRILVLTTDRDGFTNAEFEMWKQLPYPKVLFTSNPAFANHEDSVFFRKYQKYGCVPDLIPEREFYRKGKVVRAFQRCIR